MVSAPPEPQRAVNEFWCKDGVSVAAPLHGDQGPMLATGRKLQVLAVAYSLAGQASTHAADVVTTTLLKYNTRLEKVLGGST